MKTANHTGDKVKFWSLLLGMVIVALICSPVLAVSKSDLIASYRTTDHFPVFKDSTTDIPPIEVLSPANPYHFGEAVYCDLKGDLLVNGWGKSGLPYTKPKWNGSGIRGEIEPQPTPTFGFLEISSDPSGANVYLDGNMWGNNGTLIGTTPITTKVETGSHRLKLTRSGYSGARYITPVDIYYGTNMIEITVTEGKTVRVSAVLIPGNNFTKEGLL